MTAPLVALSNITRSFGDVRACDGITLSLERGRIHALLGENGAGKSTLVKIIYGLLRADSGSLAWNGRPMTVHGPAEARALGIGMVFQHFNLFESMTVLQNISLAVDSAGDMTRLRNRVRAVSATYGLPLEADRHVHTLSAGERQRIEIIRCLLQDPQLLILDEPTSVLTPQEADRLFDTLRQLRDEGRAILYISHKLEEVRALCEHATILRGGRVVSRCDPRSETAASLAERMIGHRPVPARRRAAGGDGERIRVAGLSVQAADRFGVTLSDVSLAVRRGEILGIAGIAGNGQGELMAALSGEAPCDPGAVLFDSEPVGGLGPAGRRARGAVFAPEERYGHAAVTSMTLAENLFLTAARRLRLTRFGLMRRAGTGAAAERVIAAFDVRTTGTGAAASSLSGGNLQKFIVGREIAQDPEIMVVAQPTWGVDAGAAGIIRKALRDRADRGTAVLVISQDLDEIFEICDRIAVIAGGRLSEIREIDRISVEEVGLLMGQSHPAQTGSGRTDALD